MGRGGMIQAFVIGPPNTIHGPRKSGKIKYCQEIIVALYPAELPPLDEINNLKLTRDIDTWLGDNNPAYVKQQGRGKKGFVFDPRTVRRAFERLHKINRDPRPVEDD
jgi:hypothetical protein